MLTGKKVLIVDDDPAVVSTLGKLFTDAGASVESALSYEDGLSAIEKGKPDIGVIDLLLPQHSGLELIQAARKIEGLATFFIVLTNSVNAEHIADAMASNVTMFIQKADHDPADIVKMVADRFK